MIAFGESPHPAHSPCILAGPSHAGQDQGALWGLSYGELMPFMRVPPSRPTHFPKPHLLIKSSLGVGSQHMNFGGIQTSDCNRKDAQAQRDNHTQRYTGMPDSLLLDLSHTHQRETHTPFSRYPLDRILQTICHSKHSWLCPSRDDH